MLKLEQKLIKDKKLFAVDLKAGTENAVKQLEKGGAAVDFNIKTTHYGTRTLWSLHR